MGRRKEGRHYGAFGGFPGSSFAGGVEVGDSERGVNWVWKF